MKIEPKDEDQPKVYELLRGRRCPKCEALGVYNSIRWNPASAERHEGFVVTCATCDYKWFVAMENIFDVE